MLYIILAWWTVLPEKKCVIEITELTWHQYMLAAGVIACQLNVPLFIPPSSNLDNIFAYISVLSIMMDFEAQELLTVPFYVGLSPLNLQADDAPDQNVALEAAFCAVSALNPDGDKFLDAPVMTKTLGYFKHIYNTCNTLIALELLTKHMNIDTYSTDFTMSPNNNMLAWDPDHHFIDFMICVLCGLGLATLLLNHHRDHRFKFTFELSHVYWTFSPKYAKLGFNPSGTMLWIGCSTSSEDVWLGWALNGSLNAQCKDVKPPTCEGSMTLSCQHYWTTIMFLASMLSAIGYRDIIVRDTYPDLEKEDDYLHATNLMWVQLFVILCCKSRTLDLRLMSKWNEGQRGALFMHILCSQKLWGNQWWLTAWYVILRGPMHCIPHMGEAVSRW